MRFHLLIVILFAAVLCASAQTSTVPYQPE